MSGISSTLFEAENSPFSSRLRHLDRVKRPSDNHPDGGSNPHFVIFAVEMSLLLPYPDINTKHELDIGFHSGNAGEFFSIVSTDDANIEGMFFYIRDFLTDEVQ